MRSLTATKSSDLHSPPIGSGLPNANRPKRSTHASMLIVITALMPKRFMKNGMVRMNSVSDTCEIETMMVEYFTVSRFA